MTLNNHGGCSNVDVPSLTRMPFSSKHGWLVVGEHKWPNENSQESVQRLFVDYMCKDSTYWAAFRQLTLYRLAVPRPEFSATALYVTGESYFPSPGSATKPTVTIEPATNLGHPAFHNIRLTQSTLLHEG